MTVAELGEMIPGEHRDFVDKLLDDYGVPALDEEQQQGLGAESNQRHSPQTGLHLNLRSLAHKVACCECLGLPPAHMLDSAHEQGRLVEQQGARTPNAMLRSGPTSSSLRVLRLVAHWRDRHDGAHSRDRRRTRRSFPYLALAVSVEDVRWQPDGSVQKACGVDRSG